MLAISKEAYFSYILSLISQLFYLDKKLTFDDNALFNSKMLSIQRIVNLQ